MTTKELKLAKLGKYYWYEYVQLNGYAFHPTNNGIKKLAKNLDLNITHLRKCINLYLEA